MAAAAAIASAAATGCGADAGPDAAGQLDLTIAPAFLDAACAAWDGEAYAVVWATHTDPFALTSSLAFARISPAGEFIRPPQTLFLGLDELTTSCRLLPAEDGARYDLLFSEDDGCVELLQFTPAGAILGSPNELIDEPGPFDATLRNGEPAILYADFFDGLPHLLLRDDGDEVELNAGAFVHFIALRWHAPTDAFYAVLAGDGMVGVGRFPGADPLVFDKLEVGGESTYNDGPVSVAVTGDAAYGSWTQDGAFVFQAFGLGLEPTWPGPVALPGLRAAPGGASLAAVGDDALIAWQSDHETPLPQIYAAAMPRDPAPIVDMVQVSDGLHSYRNPQLIAGPDAAAVIFEGSAAGSDRLFWAPVPR